MTLVRQFSGITLEMLEPVAAEIFKLVPNRKIFLFYGTLGAGKTTLVQAFCKVLGLKDQVQSPTFGLVHEYGSGSSTVYHFDLYRLKSASELEEIGFYEYLNSNALCFIEWPEKGMPYEPETTVSVLLEPENQFSRRITITL
jgi:tRNA threonylcarbamoyladenosine biosynthesis protein TsaE